MNKKERWEAEKKRYYDQKAAYFIAFCILFFVIVFNTKTVSIISFLFVNPLLSTIVKSSYIVDIICVLIAIYICRFFYKKAINQVIVSAPIVIFIALITVLYLIFRLPLLYRLCGYNMKFIFVRFEIPLLSRLYLLDILFAPAIAVIIYYRTYLKHFNVVAKSPGKVDFLLDSPVILNESNDLLSRRIFINNVKEKILATQNPDSAFAIGIIGKWGSGKTTFVNTLADTFKNNLNIVSIIFNPWMVSSGSITAAFFKDLSIKLSIYDDSLKIKLLKYSQEVLSAIDNSYSSILKTLLLSVFNHDDTQNHFDAINSSIRLLNKKIIIYLDDIDRLDKEEVLEVLKLIRNTANFGNIFFIAAFDRKYVIRCINKGLGRGSGKYLEKIFQHEYQLPLSQPANIYIRYFYEKLLSRIDIEDHVTIRHLLTNLQPFEFVPPIGRYISSFRDIDRLINTLLISYDGIKRNIYLPDFISISILKLKYPEVHNLIYYRRDEFLTTSTFPIFDYNDLLYMISEETSSDGNNLNRLTTLETTYLFEFLNKNNSSYSLVQSEVSEVCYLIYLIFGFKQTAKEEIRNFRNHHLSVVYRNNYNRYFDFSMLGRLDQQEFNDLFNNSQEKINQTIELWNKSKEIVEDLKIKFENIDDINTLNRFFKVIEAIVYFTQLPNCERPRENNKYNIEDFYLKIKARYNDNNLSTEDKIQLKEFFQELLTRDSSYGRWDFLQDFMFDVMQNHSEEDFLFTSSQFIEILKNGFLEALSKETKYSYHLFDFYLRIIKLSSIILDNDIVGLNSNGRLIKDSMKNFISTEDNLVEFLRWNIYQHGRGNHYRFSDNYLIVFDDKETFEHTLEMYKDAPSIKEFRDFFEKNNSSRGEWISYDFKILKIPTVDDMTLSRVPLQW